MTRLLKWIEYRPSHMPGYVRACGVSGVAWLVGLAASVGTQRATE